MSQDEKDAIHGNILLQIKRAEQHRATLLEKAERLGQAIIVAGTTIKYPLTPGAPVKDEMLEVLDKEQAKALLDEIEAASAELAAWETKAREVGL